MAILGLFTLLIVLLNTSWFQNYLTSKVTSWLSEEIDYPIVIGNASIDWFDELQIDEITIHDRKDSAMIDIERLTLNYRLSDLVFQKIPGIEAAEIVRPRVLLVKHAGLEHININNFIHALNLRFKPKKKKKVRTKLFELENASIKDGLFGYYDFTHNKITGKLDYYHFRIEQINAKVANVWTDGRNFDLDVNQLSAYEPSRDEHIDHISGHYFYSDKKMALSNMDVNIGTSHLTNYLAFEYDSIKDFSDFNNRIQIITDLDSTRISSKDLELFAPSLKGINEVWTISGKTKGTVSSLSTDTLTLSFGNGSTIQGKLNLDGLPNFYETFMDVKIIGGNVQSRDLVQYFPSNSTASVLKFGKASVKGNFIGFPLDFVADGSFNTDLGHFRSDINLKLSDEVPTYRGNLVTRRFNLGELIDKKDILGKISMEGNVSGTGFGIDKINLDLDAKISNMDISNYPYKNIQTIAHISKDLFEGEIKVDDINLRLHASGIASFTDDEKPIININTKIPHANLQELFGFEQKSVLSTNASLNFQGVEIDQINGSSTLSNFQMSYGSKDFKVDTVFMISTVDSNHRFFELKSSIANVLLNGKFNFTSGFKELMTVGNEYVKYFQNNEDSIQQYYASKTRVIQPHNAFFKIELNNIDSLAMLYTQSDFHIEPKSFITGNVGVSDSGFFLKLESEFNNINYLGTQTDQVLLNVNTSKNPFSNKISSLIELKSPEQELIKGQKTKDLYCNVDWKDERILFGTGIKQKDNENHLATSGEIDFLKDHIKISFDSTDFRFQERLWNIDKKNVVLVHPQEIEFDHFVLISDTQRISLAGKVSENKKDTVSLGMRDISLEILDPFLPTPLKGDLNGEIHVSRLFSNLKVVGDVEVKDFEFSGSNFGDIKGMVRWINKDNSIYTDMDFIKEEEKILNFKGRIYPLHSSNNLDLVTKIYPLKLNTLEPIFKEYASDFKGVATGKIWITGPFSKPLYNGHIYCDKAGLKVNYLNTDYSFSDFIYLDDDMFSFKNVTIKDEFNHEANIFGNIIHDNFARYYFDLFGSFKNFQLLNTSIEDNELYYGTAYGTGSYGVQGPMDDINIWTEAKSDKETHLHIPLSSYEDIEQSNYIYFKKFENEDKQDTIEEVASGIKLDFNLEITPDAYFEIIFDLKAGDIIRGRGNGNLKLGIDTRGDFSLLGKYELEEGAYNFTIVNLVNKEFAIDKGSTINWTGNPYEGALDIRARYAQNASLRPIIDTSFNPQIFTQYPALKTKKYPVDVLLDLSGELLHPNIDLDINVKKGYPLGLETSIGQFKSVIANNEQELNRQVFSLMVLKQLSSINSRDNFDLGTSASNSISELLSNQLSYWMSQVDENLEVEIDLAGLDQEAVNAFQLRLSYTFLDGKLRVTRDGNFNNYNDQRNSNNLVGEWTIEYLLSEDGKLRMKMYNKNNQNSLFSGTQNTTTNSAGVSIMFTESFDHIRDLWKKDGKKESKSKNK